MLGVSSDMADILLGGQLRQGLRTAALVVPVRAWSNDLFGKYSDQEIIKFI